ncbi:MAG: hypothetical protein A2X56_06935 [Nitrospirae bacterium GWC2_57_13]|nr:MAG: hypothetical protein A2X56_06935 [Nitrospirae bacterium GWC2_57_13]OGW44134.1 MAG: hypothetical protein A2X57_01670 [Nitrospirae bacterium GWD2_57_8]
MRRYLQDKHRNYFFFNRIDDPVLQTQARRSLPRVITLQFFIMKPGKLSQLVRAVPKYNAFPKFIFLNNRLRKLAANLFNVVMLSNAPHYDI